MARVFAIASAKGGVGKTTTTANLGAILAETGADVVVIDGDIGMANLGAALGIESPPTTLHDVLSGDAKASEATYEGPGGVYVVPGDTALSSYASADPETLPSVLRTHSQADYVLIDVGAGVSHETSLPLSLADEVLLVSTPERDALRDTEKTRQLTEQLGGTIAGAVITRTEASTPVSELATGSLAATILSSIPEDEAVRDSLAVGEPLSTYAPNSPAAAAYRELVAELTGVEAAAPPESEAPADPASTSPDSIDDADSIDAEPAGSAEPDSAATADTSAGPTTEVDGEPEPADSELAEPEPDQVDADAASDERPAPEAESKWAEAATGTGIDVDEQLADEAAAMSDADDEPTTAPEDADEPETDQPSVDAADTDDEGDDTEPAAADADTDDGVTPEPTTETITEGEPDASSPVADVAEGITPDPSADDDADFADDAEPTPDPETGDAAAPAEEAIPFRDEDAVDDAGDDVDDEPAESADSEPTAAVSDGPADSDDSESDEPLIPDAEGGSSPTPDEPSAMTTELGGATGDTAGDEDDESGDDDEKKGFFRRLFFG